MEEESKTKGAKTAERLAIIRIRGVTGVREEIKKTLDMLKLHRKNNCVIVPKTEAYVGMCKKVKDFATFGIIDDDTYKLLVEKRGKEGDTLFTLHPPRKGYGRKGIKIPFSVGGGLGSRKEKINDLIKRMI